jgi:hypothetical protein
MKKAIIEMGWAPQVQFTELVRIMENADLEAVRLASAGGEKTTLKETSWENYQWQKINGK